MAFIGVFRALDNLKIQVNLFPAMLLVASTADSDKINKEFIMNMGSRLVTKEKTGFTLAEILITLGIIGVVAAVTILKVD